MHFNSSIPFAVAATRSSSSTTGRSNTTFAVPLGEVAKVAPARGPTSIRTENGQLATYIYVDIRSPTRSRRRGQRPIPARLLRDWSGQYEYLERAAARLKIVVPVTLLIIFMLLYLNFRSITETMIVMLSLPFALVGGLWLMWWLTVSVAGAYKRLRACLDK